jgi:hypothetical protein
VSFTRYSLIVLAAVSVSLAVALPVLGALLDEGARQAAIVGAGLATLNTLAAYALVLWSERRSTNIFMGAVLGGMVGRMLVMLAAVAAAVVYLDFPKVPLAVSLLSYFVPFLILELLIVHKRTSQASAR